jgi:hypothetical protein
MQAVLLANVTFFDVVWWMVVAFFLMLALWVFIAIIADIFARADMAGLAKGLWLLAVFIFPLIGSVAYVIARPPDARSRTRAPEASDQQLAATGYYSAADEITKAHDLHQSGAINEEEFERLKRTAMGSL